MTAAPISSSPGGLARIVVFILCALCALLAAGYALLLLVYVGAVGLWEEGTSGTWMAHLVLGGGGIAAAVGAIAAIRKCHTTRRWRWFAAYVMLSVLALACGAAWLIAMAASYSG
jgi:hypothetical protein